jgi:hypothetical protein
MDLNELNKNPEQIKALISLLQGLLPKEEEVQTDTITEKQKDYPFKSRRKNSFTEHTNKFVDMPESKMHREDSTIDKKLSVSPPVARSRNYTPVQATCRICGKKEFVNPAIVYDLRENRYKCNTCSTSSG